MNFEDNLSAKDIISRLTCKPERGLFTCFYNPPINKGVSFGFSNANR